MNAWHWSPLPIIPPLCLSLSEPEVPCPQSVAHRLCHFFVFLFPPSLSHQTFLFYLTTIQSFAKTTFLHIKYHHAVFYFWKTFEKGLHLRSNFKYLNYNLRCSKSCMFLSLIIPSVLTQIPMLFVTTVIQLHQVYAQNWIVQLFLNSIWVFGGHFPQKQKSLRKSLVIKRKGLLHSCLFWVTEMEKWKFNSKWKVYLCSFLNIFKHHQRKVFFILQEELESKLLHFGNTFWKLLKLDDLTSYCSPRDINNLGWMDGWTTPLSSAKKMFLILF